MVDAVIVQRGANVPGMSRNVQPLAPPAGRPLIRHLGAVAMFGLLVVPLSAGAADPAPDAAPSAPPAGQVAPPPARPQPQSGEGLAVTPSILALNPREQNPSVDVSLVFQVDPAEVGGTVSFGPVTPLPGGVTITPEPVGPATTDMASDGRPTGKVTQRARLSFNFVPPRLEASAFPLTVRFGKMSRTVDLSVSNIQTPATGATLVVEGAPELNWRASEAIQLNVWAKGAEAAALNATAGPFFDSDSHQALNVAYCLAASPNGPCGETLTIPANSQRTLWLAPAPGGAAPTAGRYAGTVRLIALNGLEADRTLTLIVSPLLARALGVVALTIGVVAAWILTIWLPYWQDRSASLRPFARLVRRVKAAGRRLAKSHAPHTAAQIQATLANLSVSYLRDQGLIGGCLPPYGRTDADPAGLKVELEAQAKRVAAIEMLVHALLEKATKDPARGKVDALAAAAAFPQPDLAAEIETAATGKQLLQAAMVVPIPSLGTLEFRQAIGDLTLWFFSAATTIITGIVLVIAANPAFGNALDLVTALLWGLGMTAGGAKLTAPGNAQFRTVFRPAPGAGTQGGQGA